MFASWFPEIVLRGSFPVWLAIISVRLWRSAFWKRANGSLMGERMAAYATVASIAGASGRAIAL